MAKISNSEINALIRKLEAEIKPTEKELKNFEKNWKPNKEESLLLKLAKDLQDAYNLYTKIEKEYRILKEQVESHNSWANDPDKIKETMLSFHKKKLFKQINIQELKDDLLLSGLSSDFNLEEWLKDAKTKYVK